MIYAYESLRKYTLFCLQEQSTRFTATVINYVNSKAHDFFFV
jgi:hypothetical protein